MLTGALIAGASWMLYDARQKHWHVAERSAENLALGLERDLRHTMEILDLLLRTVVAGAQRPELPSLHPDLKQAVLFDGAVAAESFGGIVVADEAGWAIHDSASAVPRPINVMDRDYF